MARDNFVIIAIGKVRFDMARDNFVIISIGKVRFDMARDNFAIIGINKNGLIWLEIILLLLVSAVWYEWKEFDY